MTDPAIQKLINALGEMLTLIEDRVDTELSAREQESFDQAAELYAEMKDRPVKKTVRRAG